MYQIDRRTALMVPVAAGVAALPVKARAQSVAGLADRLSGVEGAFQETAIRRAAEFSLFFNAVWRLRITLSLAVVVDGSEETLEQILAEAQDRLQEAAADGLSDELSTEVKQNCIRFQNTALALGTNEESGEVRIEGGLLFAVREIMCPLYPFCQ